MTTEEKAIETLIWVCDYIRNLPNSHWGNQQKLLTILEKVETTLKGFEK